MGVFIGFVTFINAMFDEYLMLSIRTGLLLRHGPGKVR